mmetsp:Transcript_48116/g.108390  ORF Transcript_48116/g.108390 Transcript_48116/m.108390 type:complete len:328 (+) Transcript_48116:252-1235(+)
MAHCRGTGCLARMAQMAAHANKRKRQDLLRERMTLFVCHPRVAMPFSTVAQNKRLHSKGFHRGLWPRHAAPSPAVPASTAPQAGGLIKGCARHLRTPTAPSRRTAACDSATRMQASTSAPDRATRRCAHRKHPAAAWAAWQTLWPDQAAEDLWPAGASVKGHPGPASPPRPQACHRCPRQQHPLPPRPPWRGAVPRIAASAPCCPAASAPASCAATPARCAAQTGCAGSLRVALAGSPAAALDPPPGSVAAGPWCPPQNLHSGSPYRLVTWPWGGAPSSALRIWATVSPMNPSTSPRVNPWEMPREVMLPYGAMRRAYCVGRPARFP